MLMKTIKSVLRPLWYRINGLPPLTDGEISAEQLRRYIDKPNPVIVEIGANDGSHTIWFRELFPDCTIHCFEPDERAIERLRNRVGDVENVFIHQLAVGNVTGTLTFYPSHHRKARGASSAWDASGSIKRPTGHLEIHPEIDFGQPHQVPSVRLDDWCREQEVNCVDFIWMDVQGAELDVFAGAHDTLRKTRYLYTEYAVMELYEGQPTLKEILGSLKSFRPKIRFLNDILLENSSLN